MTRLASNKIFPPSNKIHRGVCRAKDLSAPLYKKTRLQRKSPHPYLKWLLTSWRT